MHCTNKRTRLDPIEDCQIAIEHDPLAPHDSNKRLDVRKCLKRSVSLCVVLHTGMVAYRVEDTAGRLLSMQFCAISVLTNGRL
jgi:hypothetical protein